MDKGFVYLVGAGPGRADLITLRGAELIKTADCIICDKLVNPALLKFARKDAEVIHVPKRIGKGSFTQRQINELLVEKAGSGKMVVRLKGGDPCIFGRCAEELAACVDAGIDFEIVPGVTAAIAGAGYAGIILTDRKSSSQVVFVTGREAEGKQNSNIDWNWLAKFGGTIVFYMGVANLDFITRQLIENGMAEGAPAALIADATLPSQRVVRAPLARLTDRCRQKHIEPPAVVVIGAAAEGDTRLNWFMKKPLFGKNIVVTRDASGNAEFAAKIVERGGNPVEVTTIKIKSLTNTSRFLKVVGKAAEFDWIIFTSSNGVEIFFDFLQALGKDARAFCSAKIAAIGSETAAALAGFGVRADFVPSVYTSRELAKQLAASWNLHGKKVLLLRSQLASNELVERLARAGAQVSNVPVYRILSAKARCDRLIKKISSDEIDWLTFASPSSVSAFFEQIQPDLVNSSSAKVASIGPTTSQELRSLGVKVDVTAAEHTIDGLLAALEEACK